MKLNYKLLEEPKLFNFDICILGAGAAGIICASELRDKFPDRSICLIESGDYFANNPHNRELRELESSKLKIKRESREFTLGGATSTWGGVTAHFEEFETQGRAFLEKSDWVTPFSQLEKYYRKAINGYGFINTFDTPPCDHPLFKDFTRRPFKAHAEAINYASYLREDIDLIYNTHVTAIFSNADSTEITKVSIQNIDNRVLSHVTAKRFVIALGAIETIKLLLNSVDKKTLVLGEEEKWLGRYFMNHPKGDYGSIEFFQYASVSDFVGTGHDGMYQYTGISLPKSIQEKEQLLNSYVRLEPVYSWRNDYLVGKFIAFFLGNKWVKNLFLKLYKNEEINMLDYNETGDTDEQQHLQKHSAIKSLKFLSQYIWHRLSNTKPKIKTYKLRNFLEMEPRFENCVTLSEKADMFGNKQANIAYDLSESDKKSVIVLHEEIRKYLTDNNLGTMKSRLAQEKVWPIADDASHHIGGTVMGKSSGDSFVNKNLRVHSKYNLYICSSSVFPTSGSHNPTFTIAALACLLADRISDEIRTIKPASVISPDASNALQKEETEKECLVEDLV